MKWCAILSVISSVMLELLQHFLDIPYTNMASLSFFDDGCNLATARMITKPVMFYVLFIAAQLYGVWVFWYCANELVRDIVEGDNDAAPWRWNAGGKAENKSKPTFYSDEIRKLIWLSIGEIPILMILEYFYKRDSIHEQMCEPSSISKFVN